jgi:hypothetical protein
MTDTSPKGHPGTRSAQHRGCERRGLRPRSRGPPPSPGLPHPPGRCVLTYWRLRGGRTRPLRLGARVLPPSRAAVCPRMRVQAAQPWGRGERGARRAAASPAARCPLPAPAPQRQAGHGCSQSLTHAAAQTPPPPPRGGWGPEAATSGSSRPTGVGPYGLLRGDIPIFLGHPAPKLSWDPSPCVSSPRSSSHRRPQRENPFL